MKLTGKVTIADIKQANKEGGWHWFDPDTMAFFKSYIESKVYQGPGGIYFISSECMGDEPRKFTVRKVGEDGRIIPQGQECRYHLLESAQDEASKRAKGA